MSENKIINITVSTHVDFPTSTLIDVFTYVNYFLHCFIILSLIYLWQVLSGILFWGQQAGTRIWEGYTIVTYSLIYNFIPVFIFTYPILQAIIPILYRSLGNYYLNKYHKYVLLIPIISGLTISMAKLNNKYRRYKV